MPVTTAIAKVREALTRHGLPADRIEIRREARNRDDSAPVRARVERARNRQLHRSGCPNQYLAANDVDTSTPTLALGDIIRMDPKTDTCIGPNAAAAGALAKRTYREPFVLPDSD